MKLTKDEKSDEELRKIFSVGVIPLEGCDFRTYPWNMSCLMSEAEKKRKTTYYEDTVSSRVGAKPRHGIGAERVPITKDPNGPKGPGMRCDEGHWVEGAPFCDIF